MTLDELDATEQLVAALYATMGDAPLFKRLTLLYFAAASYAESARRLGGRSLRPVSCSTPTRSSARSCSACAAAGRRHTPSGAAREALLDRIDRAIEPFDVAGLRDRARADWYPVLAEICSTNASKLQATAGEVERLLERCGFARPATTR